MFFESGQCGQLWHSFGTNATTSALWQTHFNSIILQAEIKTTTTTMDLNRTWSVSSMAVCPSCPCVVLQTVQMGALQVGSVQYNLKASPCLLHINGSKLSLIMASNLPLCSSAVVNRWWSLVNLTCHKHRHCYLSNAMPLNPFSVRHFLPKVELMYLLCIRRHYRDIVTKVAENGVARPYFNWRSASRGFSAL